MSQKTEIVRKLKIAEAALHTLGELGDRMVSKGQTMDPDQRLAFYQDKGKKLVELMTKYEEVPVGPREFVESPEYLNQPPGHKDGLYPEVMKCFVELNSGEYETAVLAGGIGVSKTTLANYTLAYQAYRLLCLRNPQNEFGLMSSDEIVFIIQSINARLAKVVDYGRLRRLMLSSPWFTRVAPFRTDLESEIRFLRKNIVIRPVSGEDTGAIGQNVFGGSLDEVNFMAVVADSKSKRGGEDHTYDQAKELYRAITARRTSRFMAKGGGLPGIVCVISSKQYPGEFTEQLINSSIAEKKRTGKTRTYVYDKRKWDVRPDLYLTSKWFKVFIGDDNRKPRILEAGETVDLADSHLVMEIPDEYRQQFEDNLLSSLRDFAGVSTQALHPFIPDVTRIAAAFGTTPSILTGEWCDFKQRSIGIDPSKFQKPEQPRFIHIDLGLTSDSAGVACGYIDEFVEVKRGANEFEVMPSIVYDFLLEVRPPKNDEIPFDSIRSLLYAMREEGLNLKWATLDSFQSRDMIQMLNQKGIKTGLRSIDTDLRAYQFLKSALMDRRIKAPTNEVALRELRQLEWNIKKKMVDHPPPPGSKDVSDAMAGVCFGLTMQLSLWVAHGVRARLPNRLIQEVKGQKDAA